MSLPFDFSAAVNSTLPPESAPWSEFPQYNFVGGHNDPDSLPLESLINACNNVMKREGKTLSTYSLESGPQGLSLIHI